MSQSSISVSIPDTQLNPFHEFFRPDSLSHSQTQSLKISDSQSSESTTLTTSRDERIAIQTALKFQIPHSRIHKVLHVTEKQIIYARNHQVTPQKSKRGKRSLLTFLNTVAADF